MAIWSFTSARNFEELLDLSVAHPGDSDSVAAVACSLWGIASRPGWQKYYEQVNEREMIDFFLEKFL
jgi:ADP-ribosylglycohydrolase